MITDSFINLTEIPYSEHSSFTELEMFMKGMRIWCPRTAMTVNVGNDGKRKAMEEWIEKWRLDKLAG